MIRNTSKGVIFMKKMLSVIIGMASVLFLHSGNVYAEMGEVYDMRLYGWYVTESDIYDLNKEYRENKDFDNNDAVEFLMKRAEQYGQGVYPRADSEDDFRGGWVVDEDGCIRFGIWNVDSASSSLAKIDLFLDEPINGTICSINAPENELKNFMETCKAEQEKKRKECGYAENAVYTGKITEEEEEKLNQEMQMLWEHKEELNIIAAFRYGNLISVDVLGMPSNESMQNIQKYAPDAENSMNYVTPENVSSVSELDSIEAFIEVRKNDYRMYYWGEDYLENIKSWMKREHQNYPAYTYDNLMTLGYICAEDRYYDNISDELEKFMATVPYQKNQDDPFDESDFGDPKHLAIKIVLQKYKELYPKEGYETLYEKYLKDINENEILTQEQKRERYCWKILKAEKELKNMETAAQESKESLPAAIAGCIVLVIGAVAVKVWMKKEGK